MLRALLRAESPLAARDAAHLVRFIVADNAFEIVAGPIDDLLEATVIAARRAKCGIGDEQDALLERDWLVDLPVGKGLDVGREATERGPVAPGILKQRFVLRDPDVAAPALQPIVENAGRDLTPLSRTGAVSQEVTLAIDSAAFGFVETNTFLARREPAGQKLGPGVTRIDNCFELRGGKQALGNGAFREVRHIVGDWRGDRSHRHRFHERGRMLAGRFEHDPTGPVGQIDADLIEQGRGRIERGVADRQDIVANRRMIRPRRRPRALDRTEQGQAGGALWRRR